MRIKNNLMSIIFQDFDSRYFIEIILIIGICATVYFSYIQSISISPHLNFGYPEIGVLFFFKQYLYYASYPLFTIFYIVTIVISSYEVFLFSSSIVRNKFLVMYSMGFRKNSIILSYFILFVIYPLLILSISYFVISYVDFFSIEYYIIWHLVLFTFISLMFFISIGMVLSAITKNLLIPGAFIIIFFYFLVPLVYIRPQNTILYHVVDPVYGYLNYGFNHITFIGVIIEVLLSLMFIFLTMLIARYRDMKVVR
ncbi:hypothetical protein ACLIKE_09850 [Ferroplasma acidiphilum]|nr:MULTISPECIES: hypothetical protein [Ferroplasma]ARD85512.1 hypothetical protein FAD_1668 [Ferroplasma acidiphilum]NOL59307.1 hypothetical protein [Ferroplasma acidiphilum]